MEPADKDSQPGGDGRDLAAEVLFRARMTGPFVADLFDEMAPGSGLDERDRRLAFELATGVVRHLRTLDRVVAAFSERGLNRMPGPLRLLLRLGVYQLLFLDRVPDHAAVDQTVELAKRWARKRIGKHAASIGGFVNAVLRAVAGSRQKINSPRGHDSRRLLERPDEQGYVLFDRDIFPPPDEQAADYLADAFSLDPWLAGRWIERWGFEQAAEVARAQNRHPRLTLRVNSLRSEPLEVAEMLRKEGVTVRLAGRLLRVENGDALAASPMELGLIQPQDAWTWTIVEQLDAQPGMTVLDRCAAPGTKTTQIVERMKNRGRVLAVDVSKGGLAMVRSNCQRMGCRIVQTLSADEMPAALLEVGQVERALVDAPCSNSGVLARRPEARWRIDADSLAEQARLQRELLMDALNWLAPRGRCVYSTCSIEPEENEQVVQAVVRRRHGQARLVADKLTLPSARDDHDGGYWAVIERVR